VAFLSDFPTFKADAPNDFARRLELIDEAKHGTGSSTNVVDPAAVRRFRDSVRVFERMDASPALTSNQPLNSDASQCEFGGLGMLLLSAFPERLAVAEQSAVYGNRFRFASGLSLPLSPAGDSSALQGAACLVVVDADTDRKSGVIRLAEPINMSTIRSWAIASGRTINQRTQAVWKDGACRFESVEVLITAEGTLPLGRPTPAVGVTGAQYAAEIALKVAANPGELQLSESAAELVQRITLAHGAQPDSFMLPDVPETIRAYLANTLPAHPTPGQVPRLDQVQVAEALNWWLHANINVGALNHYLPTSLKLPTGRSVRIRYGDDGPHTSGRVQDFFGCLLSPTVGGGSIPVMVELLSPAGRVVARTTDLDRFWSVGYPGTRSDLRGRYPKHNWPENPRLLS
jgi:ATP-dependent helicase HrpB